MTVDASAPSDLWRLSATELAQAIRDRWSSSQEVVEAHLRRIEAVNEVNAVPVVMAEEALEAAKAADRVADVRGELPLFHGVPFTVKANIDVAGTPTTQGAEALLGAYPLEDAPAVSRLRAAGAIPIGRTNLPTGGMGWICESEMWGATRNPWDPARTPGASSGGEAVALATGMSPLGLGNDGLGSLRWPAQCCGVSCLRPTLGRIPRGSSVQGMADFPISVQLVEVDGPMARRIADLREAFDLLAGPSWRDPWTVPAPLRGPEPATPVRVALVADPASQGVSKEVEDGLLNAASALEDAGYAVEAVEPPSLDIAAKTALDMLAPDWRLISPMLSPLLGPKTKTVWDALLEMGGDPDRAAAMQAYVTRQSLLRAWGEFQESHPLIVAPVSTDLPFEADKGLNSAEMVEIVHGLRMTIAVNALGLPAVVLPVGTAGGLPQSVQIIAARYREDLCLDAAAALEERVGVITPIDPE